MHSCLCTVRSPQGVEYAAATKELTSGSYHTPGRPQENWQAVLDNCCDTFVPGDLLSISFIGIVLHCRTVKSSGRKTTWMEFPEVCCSAYFCSPVDCMNVSQRQQEQFYAITILFALGAPNILSSSSISPLASVSSLSHHIISNDLQNPDYAKCRRRILTNFSSII